MRISSPKELLAFLSEIGAAPKKSLSQNFLVDANVLRKICQLAEVEEGDLVVEIGPGPGALTWELLAKGATVIAIEKDRKLAKALERLQTPDRRLTVIEADIMEAPLATILQKALPQGQAAKVVANLPYQLTSPILGLLAPMFPLISQVVVMVQDEVAQRMCAHPGGRDYGSLTAFLNYYGSVRYGFKVSHNCFYPKPKIYSAVIRMDLTQSLDYEDPDALFSMIRTAFQQRRKMMRGSLRDLFPGADIEEALSSIGQLPEARPEKLGIQDFVRLHRILSSSRTSADQE